MEIDDIPIDDVDPDAEAVRAYAQYRTDSTSVMHLLDTDKPTVVWVVKRNEFAPRAGEEAGKRIECWAAVGQDIAKNLQGSFTNFRSEKDTGPRAARQQWANDGGVAVGLADPASDVLNYVQPMPMKIVPACQRAVMRMKFTKAALPAGPGLAHVVGADATTGVFDTRYNAEVNAAKQANRPLTAKHPCQETLEHLEEEARMDAPPEVRDSAVALVPVIPHGKEPASMYFSIAGKIVPIRDVPGADAVGFDTLFPVLARAGMLAFPSPAMTLRDAVKPPPHRKERPLICIACGDDIAERYLAATGKPWLQDWMVTQSWADDEKTFTCSKQGSKGQAKSIAHKRGGLVRKSGTPVRRQAWEITIFQDTLASLGMPDDAVNLLSVWKEYNRWLYWMNQVLVCTPSPKTIERGDNQPSRHSEQWECGFTFDVLLPVFDLRGFIASYGIPLRPADVMVFMRNYPHEHSDAATLLAHSRYGVILMNARSQAAMSLIPSQQPGGGAVHAAVNPKSGNYSFYAVLPKSHVPVVRSIAKQLQQGYAEAQTALELQAAQPADVKPDETAIKDAKARMAIGYHLVNKFLKGVWHEAVPKTIQESLAAFACDANDGLLLFAVDKTFGGDDAGVRKLLEQVFPRVADVPDAVDETPGAGKRGRDDATDGDAADIAAVMAAEAAAEPPIKRQTTE
ncbi:MAG TPA: hypothetical protein VKD22_15630 [Ramlibacter sp.]|nr:hypothetical protein [Ramlibacter sp.]